MNPSSTQAGGITRWTTGDSQCELCPRHCRLHEGQRAFCFVRQRVGDRIVLTTYGRSTGVCIDPDREEAAQPLPARHVDTCRFGTAGCNLGCRFCQNSDISKSRDDERLSYDAPPRAIADAARLSRLRVGVLHLQRPGHLGRVRPRHGRRVPRARRAHRGGDRRLHRSRGDAAEFFDAIDAANVDLKAFTDRFYEDVCLTPPGGLSAVRDTLVVAQARDARLVRDHDAADSGPQRRGRRRCATSRGGSRVTSVRTSPCTSRPSTRPTGCWMCRTRRPAHAVAGPGHRARRRAALRLHRQRARPRGPDHVLPGLREGR